MRHVFCAVLMQAYSSGPMLTPYWHVEYMHGLRRLLRVRWFDHKPNVQVKDRTRLKDIEPRIRCRRLAFFGHVALMQPGIPTHDALWTALEVAVAMLYTQAGSG